MKNWKVIAIIAATAIATAAAVVVLLQKHNNKRKMRFDSEEFDEEFMDDIACGEQCTFCGSDLDVELPDDPVVTAEDAAAEPAEAPAEEAPVEEDAE